MDNPDRLAKQVLEQPLPDGGCCCVVAEKEAIAGRSELTVKCP